MILFVISAQAQDVAPNDYDSLNKAFLQIENKEGENYDSLFNQQSKLTANDGANDDNFGVSVAISGDTAVVGAWLDDAGANTDQGSVYVFLRSAAGVWTLQQKLTANDGAAGDNFGYSVAITTVSAPAQTVIMVGAFGDDIGANANQGSVYVFVRASGGTTWSQQGKLNATGGAANDVFGNSVALSGGMAIIGANGADINGTLNAGAAYIFVRNGTVWEELQKLTDPTVTTNENFGWSVDISGNSAIVGTNLTTSLAGQAHIFERTTGGNSWNAVYSRIGGGNFGWSVAISGETAVVGSPLLSALVDDDGAAAILERVNGSWGYGGAIYHPNPAVGDNFGSSVDIAGDTIVVGAVGVDTGGISERGAVYVFGRSGITWTQQQQLLDANGGISDFLGISVAISGDTVISGAWQDDVGALGQAGSVSVFKFSNAATPFDFDGDAKTDIGIFRPAPGEWWINRSSNNSTLALKFGNSSDKLVPADYTGDGKTDVALFRPSSGQWFVLRSEDLSFYAFPFGLETDTPVPADYDGDGKADVAVFRASNATWYIQKSSGGTDIIGFGATNDKPVVADYDADGKADIAIFRANGANGEWWIRRSSNGSTFATVFGTPTDKPTQGDFTGDGRADIALFRPSNGSWFVLRSEDLSFFSFPFGAANDIPAAGDYDGDGKFDACVFRPSNSTWYINRSTAGTLILQFGVAGDRPIPNAFVP